MDGKHRQHLGSPTYTDVVILGGGVAGLAAAAVLKECNVPFVTIEGRSRLGGRLYPVKASSFSNETDKSKGEYVDLGASYWHCCLGDVGDKDGRSRRPPRRSVSGLAKLSKPRVALVAGEIKWEDPVHSRWYNNGPIGEKTVLVSNLFLGKVLDKAKSILMQPQRVALELLEPPFVPCLSQSSQCSFIGDSCNDYTECCSHQTAAKRLRREFPSSFSSNAPNTNDVNTEDPFLYSSHLTTLDQLFALAESEVIATYSLMSDTDSSQATSPRSCKRRRLKKCYDKETVPLTSSGCRTFLPRRSWRDDNGYANECSHFKTELSKARKINIGCRDKDIDDQSDLTSPDKVESSFSSNHACNIEQPNEYEAPASSAFTPAHLLRPSSTSQLINQSDSQISKVLKPFNVYFPYAVNIPLRSSQQQTIQQNICSAQSLRLWDRNHETNLSSGSFPSSNIAPTESASFPCVSSSSNIFPPLKIASSSSSSSSVRNNHEEKSSSGHVLSILHIDSSIDDIQTNSDKKLLEGHHQKSEPNCVIDDPFQLSFSARTNNQALDMLSNPENIEMTTATDPTALDRSPRSLTETNYSKPSEPSTPFSKNPNFESFGSPETTAKKTRALRSGRISLEERLRRLLGVLTSEQLEIYRKSLRQRFCYVSDEALTSATSISADDYSDPTVCSYGYKTKDVPRVNRYKKALATFDNPIILPCTMLWHKTGDRLMVDSWNWLLNILIPPLIDAALETKKRQLENEALHMNHTVKERVPLKSSQAKLSLPEGTYISARIAELENLFPKSCLKKTETVSHKMAKIKTNKKTKEAPPDIDVRVNLTVKRIKVDEERTKDYPIEIQAVPTDILLQDTDGRKRWSEENLEVFRCRYVICTVPIGVLQASHDILSSFTFEPPLSEEKQRAVKHYGMGAHQKILVHFPTPFWPENTPQLNTTDPRFQFLNLHAYGKTGWLLTHVFPPYSSQFKHIVFPSRSDQSFSAATKLKNRKDKESGKDNDNVVLQAESFDNEISLCNCNHHIPTPDDAPVPQAKIQPSAEVLMNEANNTTPITGSVNHQEKTGDEVEDHSCPSVEREPTDEEIVNIVCDVLKKMFQLSTRPVPTKYYVTRWNSDAFSLGSYSYFGPAFSERDFYILRAPHPRSNPRVLFAGEACSLCYYQCVDGAFDTGTRAAECVVNEGLTKRPYGPGLDPIPPELVGYYVTDTSDMSDEDDDSEDDRGKSLQEKERKKRLRKEKRKKVILNMSLEELNEVPHHRVKTGSTSWITECSSVKHVLLERVPQRSSTRWPRRFLPEERQKAFDALPYECQRHLLKRWMLYRQKLFKKAVKQREEEDYRLVVGINDLLPAGRRILRSSTKSVSSPNQLA